ncbi:MAG: outer membrane lipoprotein carrier protein LolA [Deltaproteobacteria bacterium]|nr:outer membrane lipoprotein carrier protein LolA [Deltaproteobacteria bacterium]
MAPILIFTLIISLATEKLFCQTVRQPHFLCSKPVSHTLEDIQATLRKIDSFSATFQQLSYSSISSEYDMGTGRVFAKKPKFVKLEYMQPQKAVYIVSDRKAIYRNLETGEKELFEIEKEIEKLPISFFIDGKVQDGFKFKSACENENGYLFIFEKKRDGKLEFNLAILTDKNLTNIKGVKLEDFGGAVNSFIFDKFQLNPPLPEKFFTLD